MPRLTKDDYSRLKRAGKFTGTIKAAVAKQRARQLNPPPEPARSVSTTSASFGHWARVDIGREHEARVIARAKHETRKRVFSIVAATFRGAQNNHGVSTHFESIVVATIQGTQTRFRAYHARTLGVIV